MDKDFKEEAEKHWAYTKGLLERVIGDEYMHVFEYLYVEAMIHGYKHGVEDSERKMQSYQLSSSR